ncbi:sarcosine oxidase subunit gamma [Sphaerisporangium sp. NPDC004334]
MTVDRTSPLAGFDGIFDGVTGPRLQIREIPFLRQTNLRVDPARAPSSLGMRLPLEPGTWLRSGEADVVWLGPDEWLVIGEAPLSRSEEVAVTDVSAQRTTIVVAGPGARDLLAHGCALDLHPSVFGPGRCAQTTLARAQVLLIAGEEEFRVLVRASYARYLAAWLVDAAVDY